MAYKEEELNLDGMVPSSGSGKGITNITLKEGDNLLRILPPFGTNHRGVPFAEVNLHWFQLDEKSRRPLRCSYPTERYCPVCEEANILYKEKEELVEEFKDDKGRVDWKSLPKNLSVKYKDLNDKFSALRASKGWYYNALTPSGTVGVLRLSKTAATDLGNLIVKAVKEFGFNPLSLKNGATFNFKKMKTGPLPMNVEYKVEFLMKSEKTANGVSLNIDTSPVADGIIENFEKLAYDVHAMYPIITSQQLKRAMIGDDTVWKELDAKRGQKASTEAGTTSDDLSGGADVELENPLLAASSEDSVSVDDSSVLSPAELAGEDAPTAAEEDPELAALRAKLGL